MSRVEKDGPTIRELEQALEQHPELREGVVNTMSMLPSIRASD